MILNVYLLLLNVRVIFALDIFNDYIGRGSASLNNLDLRSTGNYPNTPNVAPATPPFTRRQLHHSCLYGNPHNGMPPMPPPTFPYMYTPLRKLPNNHSTPNFPVMTPSPTSITSRRQLPTPSTPSRMMNGKPHFIPSTPPGCRRQLPQIDIYKSRSVDTMVDTPITPKSPST